jgi:hypothetical protein
MGMPACYIILACFTLIIVSSLNIVKDKNILYWLGAVPALAIASYGSLGVLFGFAACPRTSSGIPMCFLSFGFFGSLALLKIFLVRLK